MVGREKIVVKTSGVLHKTTGWDHHHFCF